MPANLFAAMRPMGVCAGANHTGEFIRRYAPNGVCAGANHTGESIRQSRMVGANNRRIHSPIAYGKGE